ncbi:MAG: hypothetical protein V2G42_07810 [bacterium JZ-2024 1]
MSKPGLPVKTLYLKKTGLPFYDAARLIGVAHWFFGSSSAVVEDRGSHWRLSGVMTSRDPDIILWPLDRLPIRSAPSFEEKKKHIVDATTHKTYQEYFTKIPPKFQKQGALYKDLEVALQSGTRGYDPLSSYSRLQSEASSSTQYQDDEPEVFAAAFGASFAALARRENEKISILPIFSGHFVLGPFLDFTRNYKHQAGGWVAALRASLNILVELEGKNLPITDFAYNKEIVQTAYESGILGFYKLCQFWRKGTKDTKQALRQINLFLSQTANQALPEKYLHLARSLSHYLINPTVDRLEQIQQIKARCQYDLWGDDPQTRRFVYIARGLFNEKNIIREVVHMCGVQSFEIPDSLVRAVANALTEEGKGWFNKFVRLENSYSPDRLFDEVQRIISRASYDPQNPQGFRKVYFSRREDLQKVRSLVSSDDPRTFRAFKAFFLMEILAFMKRETQTGNAEEPGSQNLEQNSTGGN